MNREQLLFFIASKDPITIHEAIVLITEYIFDMKNIRVVIGGNLILDEKFEQAATIATNYYLLKPV